MPMVVANHHSYCCVVCVEANLSCHNVRLGTAMINYCYVSPNHSYSYHFVSADADDVAVGVLNCALYC